MKNLLNKKTFVCTIISHTPYCLKEDGITVGLGPTVQEIDYLATVFEKIYHCAPVYNYDPPRSYLQHKRNNVELIPLKPTGGNSFVKKLNHLLFFPNNLRKIKTCLIFSNIIHFRAPTGIGVLLLPWIYLFWKKLVWIKYAGSWDDKHSPITYKLQRWYLKQFPKNTKISINGHYTGLKKNFYNFINPCFNEKDYELATNIAYKKSFQKKLKLLFVGRLEKEKGLDDLFRLIEEGKLKKNIQSLKIIGDSKYKKKYSDWASSLPMRVIFCGPLPRKEVFKYYERSHILILFSKSEGFPKVVMEAGAYGCVPILTNINQLNNVIKNYVNGFTVDRITEFTSENLNEILSDRESLKFCSLNINKAAKNHTFEKYLSLVKNAILH